ncbi:Cystathionine gamma-synthase [Sporothrix stenoceras]|uniref:Cystathionine gamma-synthase n=1 Tax=Sporothrix stenoceras TaxID=5173 RepID=A0ABR3ZEX0_9PEZI
MPSIGLGESIPPDTAHAVSVSLPTWKANVGYEEGESWVVSKMVTGYPRFFIHNLIKAFAASIAERFGQLGQTAVLFPSRAAAARCKAFIEKYATDPASLESLAVVHLALDASNPGSASFRTLAPTISAVVMQQSAFPFGKQYWQHSGDGVSSRRAEYCHKLFSEGLLVRVEEDGSPSVAATSAAAAAAPAAAPSPVPQAVAGMKPFRGPKRYRRPMSQSENVAAPAATPNTATPAVPATNGHSNGRPASLNGGAGEEDEEETARFLEERFGRNLDLSFVRRAKSAILRRITGAMTADNDVDLEHSRSPPSPTSTTADANLRGVADVQEEDVYLLPCGMNAVFNAHRFLLRARPDHAHLKSINFGFPYVDTLKILEKFGAGCLFYGHASEADLNDLEKRLKEGERFLGLFCEFPGNPLLTCPNLVRIRKLADEYDFSVVVDETIGTFANVNVLPYADIVVSSLTKIFSGDCNVMGGSLVLNRHQKTMYRKLKEAATAEYDPDSYWPEDAIFMERNSRDFATRVDRINTNAQTICDVLLASPIVKQLNYPKYGPSRANYEACRIGANLEGPATASTAHRIGGYGGLLSFSFQNKAQAIAFYDAVETAKGPSLGTNFTLTSPYVVLAHYQELDWCAGLGVDPDLIRVSVGLEEENALRACFETALAAAEAASA